MRRTRVIRTGLVLVHRHEGGTVDRCGVDARGPFRWQGCRLHELGRDEVATRCEGCGGVAVVILGPGSTIDGTERCGVCGLAGFFERLGALPRLALNVTPIGASAVGSEVLARLLAEEPVPTV